MHASDQQDTTVDMLSDAKSGERTNRENVFTLVPASTPLFSLSLSLM